MSRKRIDGTPSRPTEKRKLNDLIIRQLVPEQVPYLVWDAKQANLAVQVRPSGHKAYKVIYSRQGSVRWIDVGPTDAFGLTEARKAAATTMYKVLYEGADPQVEKRKQQLQERHRVENFGTLVERYFEEHAMRHNRSWKQARYLVDRHLLPEWGRLAPADISRSHVKRLMRTITAPVTANQALAAASAIFSWAIREEVSGLVVNPCRDVERNKVVSRERVLSDEELPKFWAAFEQAGMAGQALQLILLLGQRPGEVSRLRSEHIIDGWWTMPG